MTICLPLVVDPETGTAGWYPITWTTKHEDAELVTLNVTLLSVDGEALGSTQEHTAMVTITATLEHPFWVEGREPSGYWVDAGDLEANDTLLSADGRRLRVQAAVRSAGPAMVYNFTVDVLHTYTVTELRVVVHNVNPCFLPSNLPRNFPIERIQHTLKHAEEWFGRARNSIDINSPLAKKWEAMLKDATRSTKMFDWSAGIAPTVAHLYTKDRQKYLVVQFYIEDGPSYKAGDLATAFIPNQSQLSAIRDKLK